MLDVLTAENQELRSNGDLPFDSKINFIIEAFYEIIGALVLAWLLSKTKMLELKRIKND